MPADASVRGELEFTIVDGQQVWVAVSVGPELTSTAPHKTDSVPVVRGQLIGCCLLLALGTVAGCMTAAAECEGSTSCDREGVVGTCIGGFCALPDGECPSGFSFVAGPQVTECVPEEEIDQSADTSAEEGQDGSAPYDLAIDNCQPIGRIGDRVIRRLATAPRDFDRLWTFGSLTSPLFLAQVGTQLELRELDTETGTFDLLTTFELELGPNAVITTAEGAVVGELEFTVFDGGSIWVVFPDDVGDYQILPVETPAVYTPVAAAIMPCLPVGETVCGRRWLVVSTDSGEAFVYKVTLDGGVSMEDMPLALEFVGERLVSYDKTAGANGVGYASGNQIHFLFAQEHELPPGLATQVAPLTLDAPIEEYFPSMDLYKAYATSSDVLVRYFGGSDLVVRPRPTARCLHAVADRADTHPAPLTIGDHIVGCNHGFWVSDVFPDIAGKTYCLAGEATDIVSTTSAKGTSFVVVEGDEVEVLFAPFE